MIKGQIPDLRYCAPLLNEAKGKDETHVYRHVKSVNEDLYNLNRRFKTLHCSYKNFFADDLDKDFLGRRLINPDGSLAKCYTWWSKRQIKEKMEALSSGIVNLSLFDINNEWRGMELKMIGLYSKNSVNYVISDLALTTQGVTSVPIYDTLGEKTAEYILNQTKLLTLFLTVKHLRKIMEEQKNNKLYKYLKNLVIMDEENYNPSDYEEFNGLFTVYTFEEVLEAGRKKLRNWATVTPDTAYCISYTSGTTGNPKGAVISHANLAVLDYNDPDKITLDENETHFSFLPMAHIFERLAVNATIFKKGRIGFFSGDKKNFMEDIALLKPSFFVCVPRVYNKIYEGIQTKLSALTGIKKKLIDQAIATKLYNLRTKNQLTHWFYDKIVFNKIREILGGKVKALVTGSAPMRQEVIDFLKIAFCAPMVEGYGQTENTGGAFSNSPRDPKAGHVGGPGQHIEFKLISVPEMNYTVDDKDENGKRRPRGEIWVRSPSNICGYFMNETETEKTFTKDGWLKSGDIGQLLLDDCGRMQIIDRKKNIFKLSQGEYIAPEKLEGFYKMANDNISDLYIYGDSLKSCLVAIVSIEKENLPLISKDLGFPQEQADKEDFANSQEFIAKLEQAFNGVAKENKFNGLEYLKKIYVETTPLAELGLLTTTMKKKRNQIKIHYQDKLDQMYENLE